MVEKMENCEKCGKDAEYLKYCKIEGKIKAVCQACFDVLENAYLDQKYGNDDCDECLTLKRSGIIPAICQYHLDEQFKEVK